MAEQELADLLEKHRRAFKRYGLVFTREDEATTHAFWLWLRAQPAGLDLDEQIQRTAHWWGDHLGLSAEEIIGEAERLVAEHTAAGGCDAESDCPICAA